MPGGSSEHGSLLRGNFGPSRVNSQRKSTTKAYIEAHGKPVAFYSDQHGIFRVANASAERLDGMSQFGRALHDLNIVIICAHSPVEDTNGRLRRFLPREIDIARLSTREIEAVAHRLNHTPRKCLGYQTPRDVLTSQLMSEDPAATSKPPVSHFR